MNIVIYSKSNCPNCTTAKQVLKGRGYTYTERNLVTQEERDGFYAIAGPSVRQMPQIYVNDERVGGLAGLLVWMKWKEEQK